MKDLEETIAKTVQSAIESQAKAQLITALGGVDQVAEAMIRVLCNRTVERNYRKVSLLDATLEDAMKDAMKALVVEVFDEQRAEVRKLLAARIKKDAATIADAMVASMTASTYRFELRPDTRD